MKPTKILLPLVLLSLTLNAAEVELKQGWNLIGIDSTDSVSILNENSSILEATGGGIGGGGDLNYDKEYSQYAEGVMKLGQGYWVKTDADTTLTYTKASLSTPSIELKTGWNLINPCVEIDSKNVLNDYPNVEEATGGGMGGGGNFDYNKEYSQYAEGVTIVDQGYWFKVTEPFSIACRSPYDFRAWGVGGDGVNSQLTTMLNGVNYTLVAFSKLNIASNEASTSGERTTFAGTLNTKDTSRTFRISSDYNTHDVVVKVFNNDNNFSNENLVATSDALIANNSLVNYAINIQNPDDYRPIEPTDTNIEMPPAAPVF